MKKGKPQYFTVMPLSLLVFAAGAGCARESTLLQKAQELHSYTPCGMVMNAVMPHQHATETGAISGADSSQQPAQEDTPHSAH